MAADEIQSRQNPNDSTVVSYNRFLERCAWRAKIAADLRALAGTSSIADPETKAPETSPVRYIAEAPSQSANAPNRILRWNTSPRVRVWPR